MEINDLLKSLDDYGIKYKLNGDVRKTKELLDSLEASFFEEISQISNDTLD